MKRLNAVLLLLVVVGATSCADDLVMNGEQLAARDKRRMETAATKAQEEKELRFARELCKESSMTGMVEGFNLTFDAKRNQLESAKASLSFERYQKLGQQLQGYRVEWQQLHQEVMFACRQHAVLLARNEGGGELERAEDRY